MESSGIYYHAAAFITALFVLEYGADKFVDETAALSRTIGVSETLIALLTAGAEWEELIVIIAVLSQGRPALALGNVVGSSVSNITGAFSLGLIFQSRPTQFDRSSKIYSAVLFVATSLFAALVLSNQLTSLTGGLLVAAFGVYVLTVAYFIYRGVLEAPEDSDTDSDSSSDSDSDTEQTLAATSHDSRSTSTENREGSGGEAQDSRSSRVSVSSVAGSGCIEDQNGERAKLMTHKRSSLSQSTVSRMMEDGLFLNDLDPLHAAVPYETVTKTPFNLQRCVKPLRKGHRTLLYHIGHMLIGLASLLLAGYVLSESAGQIAVQLGIADGVLGATVLSLATTLPEKFTAVLSGSRGFSGILVANTVGANVFLLTLCLGVILLSPSTIAGSLSIAVKPLEVAAVWLSSAALLAIVLKGSSKWMGFVLLGAYCAFLVLEFVLYGRVDT